MPPYAQIILDCVTAIALECNPEIEAVSTSHTLTYDLGLRSLDLARLIATLEVKLQPPIDPFDKLVPITSIRTVGDLCAAYEQVFQDAPEVSAHDTVSDQLDRSTRRRSVVDFAAAQSRRDARRGERPRNDSIEPVDPAPLAGAD